MDELAALVEEQRSFPLRRGEVIHRARAEGVTWERIAEVLGMTPHGAIKAHKTYVAAVADQPTD